MEQAKKPSERLRIKADEAAEKKDWVEMLTAPINGIAIILDELFERLEKVEQAKLRHCLECKGSGKKYIALQISSHLCGKGCTCNEAVRVGICEACQGTGHVI